MTGMTLSDARASFRGFISTRDDPDYRRLVERWSGNEQNEPNLVFEPVCENDISVALRYAVSNGIEVAVVCGGHSFMGASSSVGGAHVDLRRMRGAWVDNDHFGADGVMTIEGGASAGDVGEACALRGTCTTLPAVKELGYMGFALGGGGGWTMGLLGHAVDQFLEARIVLASGEIVTASAESHPDLFWAIKGAGYNFGVVASVKIRVRGLPTQIFFGTIIYPPSSFEAVFDAAERYLETQKEDDTLAMVYQTLGPSGGPAESIVAFPYYHGDDVAEGRRRFKDFLGIPHIFENTGLQWFPRSSDSTPQAVWMPMRRYSDGTLFTRMSPKVWLPVLDRLRQWVAGEGTRYTGTSMFLGLYGWNYTFANTGPQFDSAWPLRSPPSDGGGSWRDCAVYITTEKVEDEAEAIETAREVVGLIRRRHDEEFGVSSDGWRVYPNGSLLPGTTGEYIFKEKYPRLQGIKARYDPDNVFHKKHAIDPKPAEL
ncbi:hypothetical protein B0J15DRAFT_516503 [Fusarium solani]|uniref:FAD-binding PCMH-type domain-containing protein n=1 Tax=Fusarium solani TaxID=169388 RepID=A0A9P9GG50_FUSSL|nr:uncharacterized protein B0J15DRAFT_516503 [Fusarium solani]KAH7237920.1 hypothetical protein B0J15DRAFT_516503 [Fusarium solani]